MMVSVPSSAALRGRFSSTFPRVRVQQDSLYLHDDSVTDHSGAPLVYYTHVDSPIGPFLLAGNDEALSMASFAKGKQRREPEAGWIHDPVPLRYASEQVESYFAGERTVFDLPLEIEGTAFQEEVWAVLRTIPFGEAWSYGQVARALGNPGASRAVGAANGANILPLIIPCHRVIGANGTLTGFGGGLETKKWLLDFECTRSDPQGSLF